jgi:hypothetical protein
VQLGEHSLTGGSCEVIAKAGAAVGGALVDQWLLAAFCERTGYPLLDPKNDDTRFWQALMLQEARRVKEALYTEPSVTFDVMPPEWVRHFSARLQGEADSYELTRGELTRTLEANGLFRALDSCLDAVTRQASARNIDIDSLDNVLMVGGSTLLPEVFAFFQTRFGRDRVRAWQPFEAVANGACAYAAGRMQQSDFLAHDYALLTHDAVTGAAEHTVIVRRGTRVPTAPDLWRRQLVPACSLGEPERFFKLVICELGDVTAQRPCAWDGSGALHRFDPALAPAEQRVIVDLNAHAPTLGELRPPHPRSDRLPRLDVAFGVNHERWLFATVTDLWSGKQLLNASPVVRLV